MSKTASSIDMRPEYNFDYSKAIRRKYYKRILKERANVVVLEPDIAKALPNSAAVNDALRVVLQAGRAARRPTPSVQHGCAQERCALVSGASNAAPREEGSMSAPKNPGLVVAASAPPRAGLMVAYEHEARAHR